MPPNESDTRDKPEAGALFAWGFSIKNAWFWQQLAFTCLRLFMEFGHWKCQEYLGVTWNWNCFRWCHVWNLCIVQRICLVLGSRYGTHFLDKVWQRPNIVWKRQFILSKSLYPENIRMGPTCTFRTSLCKSKTKQSSLHGQLSAWFWFLDLGLLGKSPFLNIVLMQVTEWQTVS